MSVRSVRIAYAIPPLLGLLLGFLGLVQVSEDGLVGVSSVVTAASETGVASNARLARSLERVANDHDATIARVVADPRQPPPDVSRSSPMPRRRRDRHGSTGATGTSRTR